MGKFYIVVTVIIWDGGEKVNMDELLARARERKRITDKMLEDLDTVGDFIIDVCEEMNSYPEFLNIKVATIGWRQGSWHELVYCDDKCLRRLPRTTSDIGGGEYVAGDFQAWYNFMTREQVKEVATKLPEFLTKLRDYIETKINEETELTAKLAELIPVIKGI
jgi:hypothetical protein